MLKVIWSSSWPRQTFSLHPLITTLLDLFHFHQQHAIAATITKCVHAVHIIIIVIMTYKMLLVASLILKSKIIMMSYVLVCLCVCTECMHMVHSLVSHACMHNDNVILHTHHHMHITTCVYKPIHTRHTTASIILSKYIGMTSMIISNVSDLYMRVV